MNAENRRLRVLFINRSYWPDSEATGQLLTELCEGIAEEFDVHVLAGQPNATSEDEWKSTQVRNGVTIHRASHTVFPKHFMVLKALNFLSFVLACWRRVGKIPVPDVVVFETDPFLLPFVADHLRKRSGCRIVGYLQDIYPDVAVALGKVGNNWFIRRLRKSLFAVYRRCDQMIVLSRDMKTLLLRAGIKEENIVVIPNWADTDRISPVNGLNDFLNRNELNGRFVVMYSGNLGLTQRLEEFITAAHQLADNEEIQFVFIGRGARKQSLEKMVRDLGLTNVRFLDYQPKDTLAHSLSAADVHLIPLTQELSECLMPSKLYGILASGRPYITNAPPTSELHEITVSHDVGMTVDAGKVEDIVRAVDWAKTHPTELKAKGCRARELVLSRYTRRQAVASFAEVLRNLT
ncbi:MAG: glycosyltransferase family 4 protein [Planctomycetaceae bacterium]|nr:glycosyltransferase family 4 protein [Planctomycetaceae bacterium]